ncbi:MAG: phage recombination protein Bet [Pedobacter sp.]|nr:MAG: phage recombination protein Bet [Pedobacter sp.]
MKNELAVQVQLQDAELIGYLDNLGLTKKLTEGEKNTYLQISKAFGLNPFKREIHVSKYGENLSIITGYEVYIKRAERTGQLDGWCATTTGSVEGKDLKAIVTIYRKDRTHPFVWEALYEECVQKTREGKVTQFWQKAAFMTKKVAISQGFRLCFSDELAGMPYTADEMPETVDTTYSEVHNVDPNYEHNLREQGSMEDLLDYFTKMPKDAQTKFKALAGELKDAFLEDVTEDDFNVLLADIALGTAKEATVLLKNKRMALRFTKEQETALTEAIAGLAKKAA